MLSDPLSYFAQRPFSRRNTSRMPRLRPFWSVGGCRRPRSSRAEEEEDEEENEEDNDNEEDDGNGYSEW